MLQDSIIMFQTTNVLISPNCSELPGYGSSPIAQIIAGHPIAAIRGRGQRGTVMRIAGDMTGRPWTQGPELRGPLVLYQCPAKLTARKIAGARRPANGMECWPVSARVGNFRNNDPSLIEPIVLR
jgi:hypothetical protein